MKTPTIYQIKAATLKECPYFFTRDSMRFFGQTMRSFRVRRIGERVFVIAPYGPGKPKGATVREFTGDDLRHVDNAERVTLGLPV